MLNLNLDKDTLDFVYKAIRERYDDTPDEAGMVGIRMGLLCAAVIVGVMKLGLAVDKLEELVQK